MTVPTMRELMSDPVFRRYMKTAPATTYTLAGRTYPHPGLTLGEPWRIWVHTTTGRWLTRDYPTYPAVWSAFVKYYRRDDVRDLAIVSKRVLMPPPGEWREVKVNHPARGANPAYVGTELRWFQTFTWDGGLRWCARCRRPSSFRRLAWDHHALRRQPVLADDDPYRCVFCGIRRVAMPTNPASLVV